MKLSKLFITVAAIFSVPTIAVAGSEVTNSSVTRITHGHTSAITNYSKYANGRQYNYSQALKIDALGPNASAGLRFNGYNFTGGGDASTNRPVDPFVAGAYSRQTEYVNFSERLNQTVVESGRFTETQRSLTVTTDAF